MTGFGVGINYGLDRVRFPAPMPVGGSGSFSTVAYGCPAVPVRAVEDLQPISRRVEPIREPAGPGRRFRARGGAA